MYLNSVRLVGEVVVEPDLRRTHSGLAVVNLRVRVRRPIPNPTATKKDEVTYLDIAAFDQLAHLCKECVNKGSFIFVDGHLRSESWETPTGERKTKVKVVAYQLYVIAAPVPATQSVDPLSESAHDELPPPPRSARRSMSDVLARSSSQHHGDIPF